MTRPSRFVLMSKRHIVFLVPVPVQTCMTFVVTHGAGADGSMYFGHIEDGYGESLIGINICKSNHHLLSIPSSHGYPVNASLAINTCVSTSYL